MFGLPSSGFALPPPPPPSFPLPPYALTPAPPLQAAHNHPSWPTLPVPRPGPPLSAVPLQPQSAPRGAGDPFSELPPSWNVPLPPW
jgi:hypothetical protein